MGSSRAHRMQHSMPSPPPTPPLQTILTGLKLSGRLEGGKRRQQLWGAWQKLLGLAGLAGVPQVRSQGLEGCLPEAGLGSPLGQLRACRLASAAASSAARGQGAPGQAGVDLAGVAIGSHAQQGGWCLAAAAACCAAPPISWHGPPPHVSAPQVLWATFRPASASLLPGQLTLAAGCAVLAAETAGRLPERLRGAWAATSAWTATALFMLQPVSQLVLNFTDPASLQVSMSGSILCPGLHARRCASRGCEVHCLP